MAGACGMALQRHPENAIVPARVLVARFPMVKILELFIALWFGTTFRRTFRVALEVRTSFDYVVVRSFAR